MAVTATEPASHTHARAFLTAQGISVGKICWVLSDCIWYLNSMWERRTCWTDRTAPDKPLMYALEAGFPSFWGDELKWCTAREVV